MPKEASSYHIVDMLIYAAEKRGMLPPEHIDEPFRVLGWEAEDEE
jgi:hypothetical protein